MSSIQAFLNKLTSNTRIVARCNIIKIPSGASQAAPTIAKSRYDSVKVQPIRIPNQKLKIRHPFQTLAFPKDRSQIRGVDNMVHQLLQRQYKLKAFPPIMRNRFLSVQLFPRNHILSNFRKSNVSLVFNMHQIPMLNDKSLEIGFKSRRKYKDLQFFNSKPLPMQSACGRSKSKKQLRELFAQSLQKFTNHQKRDRLFGIFVFHVAKVPVNKEQEGVVLKDLEDMCFALLEKEQVWNDLKRVFNKSKISSPQQLKYVQYSYGVKDLDNRRVRFPFLNKGALKFSFKKSAETG